MMYISVLSSSVLAFLLLQCILFAPMNYAAPSLEALSEAIESDDFGRLEAILADHDFSGTEYWRIENNAKMTPLHVAAHSGSTSVVSFLIDDSKSGKEALTRMLEAEDVDGRTPLFYAADSASPKADTVIADLITKNASIFHVDKFGMQAIHLAVQKGRMPQVKLLLRMIGDKFAYVASSGGKSISHLVAEFNVVEFVKDDTLFSYFNASALDSLGQIPSCLAARNGNVEVARAMLARSLSINTGRCVFGGDNGGSKINHSPRSIRAND